MQKETVNKNCKMTVYDTNDTALKGFIIEPESINVSVVIKKNNVIKIEEPVTTGNLPILASYYYQLNTHLNQFKRHKL